MSENVTFVTKAGKPYVPILPEPTILFPATAAERTAARPGARRAAAGRCTDHTEALREGGYARSSQRLFHEPERRVVLYGGRQPRYAYHLSRAIHTGGEQQRRGAPLQPGEKFGAPFPECAVQHFVHA